MLAPDTQLLGNRTDILADGQPRCMHLSAAGAARFRIIVLNVAQVQAPCRPHRCVFKIELGHLAHYGPSSPVPYSLDGHPVCVMRTGEWPEKPGQAAMHHPGAPWNMRLMTRQPVISDRQVFQHMVTKQKTIRIRNGLEHAAARQSNT